MTRVVLLSTYELGAQPLGCASPAAALKAAGHEVRTHDLSLEPWPDADLSWAQAVGLSVPMHTALRLGLSVLFRLRSEHPAIAVALHGLYAPVAPPGAALRGGDLLSAGDSETAIVEWADVLDGSKHLKRGAKTSGAPDIRIELGAAHGNAAQHKSRNVPYRDGLPGLENYARLLWNGTERLVGTVEATRGCHHRCRHCPVPVIYQGKTRPIAIDDVMADIDNLVDAGAQHIHFADPDFLSRPSHARRVIKEMHERHDGLSFDVTVKVSHILEHQLEWDQFASAGLCFVTSAIESTSDLVLAHLDKGHTARDAKEAINVMRSVGVELRPSFLPFTPWTKRSDLIEIFDFVSANDLISNVDPIQYGIRLLLPPGSLLLADPDPILSSCLGSFDEKHLGVSWTSPDPLLDDLADAIALRAERAGSLCEAPEATYGELRALVFSMLETTDPGPPVISSIAGPLAENRPRLSEAWFCCAEPTAHQRDLLSATP
jgi:radical SAM superfamily enzyme YgiQ (UPF0313 family)